MRHFSTSPHWIYALSGLSGIPWHGIGVAPLDLVLVAAHDWDVAGALRAGWKAAFLARPGKVLGSLSQHPDFVGTDLREVVDQILGE
jgi:2-haloacid dehalogenase